MTESSSILGIIIFFAPCITAFVLVTFSPLRQLRQPLKFFVIGLRVVVSPRLCFQLLGMARGNGQ